MNSVAKPGTRRFPHLGLGALVVVMAAIALVMGLVVAPPDAIQGQSQRLMYVHVPSAWTAFACFGVVLVASVGVLTGRGARWDAWARAAAELGVGMTGLAIAEGSMWGHAAWGVWWTWDPRLVSTALLFLLYLGYLASRSLPSVQARGYRPAAIVGIVGFAQVPVVHFSVLWWRTLHQPPTLLAPDTAPPIAASMLAALLAAVAAFSLTALWFLRRRVAQLAPAPVSEPATPVATDLMPAPAAALPGHVR